MTVPTTAGACKDLFRMNNGESCTEKWQKIRETIHPSQQAVGYAAVKRKLKKDYKSADKAQKRMNEAGSVLPFVLGPNGVPYLIDSHHTASALEASGHFEVVVTLKKICDWSQLSEETFYDKMKNNNFMCGTGRVDGYSGNGSGGSTATTSLPVPVDVSQAIPDRIYKLKDDPWRSFGALVRKVKNDRCPPNNSKCMRGYLRECKDDGQMTAFFEFRWAYFLNDAYLRGCKDRQTSYWDDESDCKKFEDAFKTLLVKDIGRSIVEQDVKGWKSAAKLLVPLCRGDKAQEYVLPKTLGSPMGGEKLPGRVHGEDTHIEQEDPKCAPPKCPEELSSAFSSRLPPFFANLWKSEKC